MGCPQTPRPTASLKATIDAAPETSRSPTHLQSARRCGLQRRQADPRTAVRRPCLAQGSVRAAWVQRAPSRLLAQQKVGKEEVIGMLAAVEARRGQLHLPDPVVK